MSNWKNNTTINLHLTNVTGVGAAQLLNSLLPALISDSSAKVENIYIPDRGPLSTFNTSNKSIKVFQYKRVLPNIISRALECTFLAKRFDTLSNILVLGDLPLWCKGRQIVFVQTPHLLISNNICLNFESFKFFVMRLLFKTSIHKAAAFIVQTDVMREGLESSYPELKGRVHVISQPVPEWLLSSGLKRTCMVTNNFNLNLIYPAAFYNHKNHNLLSILSNYNECPFNELILTIDPVDNPAPLFKNIKCVGLLSPSEMITAYGKVDALLFLSKSESYGFPLIEAMFIGIPIICPDLPYARTLCGSVAIYFKPDSYNSLYTAVKTLRSRLQQGWWPDWHDNICNIPPNWQSVAKRMIELATES